MLFVCLYSNNTLVYIMLLPVHLHIYSVVGYTSYIGQESPYACTVIYTPSQILHTPFLLSGTTSMLYAGIAHAMCAFH